LGKISLVDVVLPTRQKKVEIRRRCVARPTDHQTILLDRLGLRLPRQLKVEPKMSIAAKSGWIFSNICLSKQLWQRFS